jgi:hypothetical protein
MKLTPMGSIQTDPTKRHLTIDQVETAVLYGGAYEQPTPYEETETYKAGDCITYTDEKGVTSILIAKHNNITGEFNLNDWKVCNILLSQYEAATNANNFTVARLLGL